VPTLSEQLTGLQKCLSDMCTQQGQGQTIIESTLQLVCLPTIRYVEILVTKTSNRQLVNTKYF